MALINCQECNRPISSNASACPHCGDPQTKESGQPQPDRQSKSRHTVPLLIGGAIVLVLVFASIGSSPEAKERQRARAAIEECRRGESDRLAPMGTRQIIRGACDTMEAEYVSNYGNRP